MKELNNFINTFKNEYQLIIERHDETVFISDGYAIYKIPLDIYNKRFRLASSRFPELRNNTTYRSIKQSITKQSISHRHCGDCYLETLYKSARKSAIYTVRQTSVQFEIDSSIKRIYTNSDFLTVCVDTKYIDLANSIGIDTYVAFVDKSTSPIVFDNCIILPTITSESIPWKDLIAIVKTYEKNEALSITTSPDTSITSCVPKK